MKSEEIIYVLESKNIAKRNQIVGVEDDEILEIEKNFGLSLPMSYKNFLSACGRSAGGLAVTLTIYYPDVLSIREWLWRTIDENNLNIKLDDDAFLFCTYDRLVYFYFRCGEGEDPVIYEIDSESGIIQSDGKTFDDYFIGLCNTVNLI